MKFFYSSDQGISNAQLEHPIHPVSVTFKQQDESEINKCFDNAFKFLQRHGGRYIIGLLHDPVSNIAIEHAWNEIDGKMVDSTPLVISQHCHYLKALSLSTSGVLDIIDNEKMIEEEGYCCAPRLSTLVKVFTSKLVITNQT